MLASPARVATCAVLTVVLVGCGVSSGQDVLVERRMANADVSSSTAPTAAPATVVARADERLSIDDALLDDGDIAPPWEFQHRSNERQGYGAGPNQTDCAPYWRYEQRHDLAGAQALWWRDGGNINHEVFRAESAAAAAEFLEAMRTLPELCPVTAWGEGGSFRTVPVDLGDHGIVGLEFIDDYSDERQHAAITVRGDLISVVWVVQWPPSTGGEFPHASTADLAGWAARASELLAGAGEAPPPVAGTLPTTTTPNGQVPPPTTTTPNGQTPPTTIATAPTNTPPPGQTPATTLPGTRPTTTLQPSPDPTGIARHMLTDADLANMPGWTIGPPTNFGGDTDSSSFEECAASSSIDELGRSFVLETTLDHDSFPVAWQYIGEVSDGATAIALVADFATLAECEVVPEPFPFTMGGGLLDVPGTSAAAVLEMSVDDPSTPDPGEFRLVVLASGPRVTALAFSSTVDHSPEPADIDRIIELAADKLTD